MRINELARELEVKAKAILDYLQELGISDKRSHSSSIEDDVALKVRRHFAGGAGEDYERGGVAVAEEEPETLAYEPAADIPPAPAVEEAPAAPAAPPVAPQAAEPARPTLPRPGATRSVLRPPVRPHVTPPPAPPPPAPPAVQAPEAPQAAAPPAPPVVRPAAPPAPSAPSEAPPAAAPPRPAAPTVQPAASTRPAAPAPPVPPAAAPATAHPVAGEGRPPAPPSAPQAPSRFTIQGPLTAPRRGVPGPVSRQGGLPQRPVVTPGPNVTPPPARPEAPRSVAPRGLAPGQPIYQPRPGMPPRGGRPGGPAPAGASPATRPARPMRPGQPGYQPGGAPGQPGRFGERRPMHPTRARPVPGAPGAAPPPAGERRPAPRPGAPPRDREREFRAPGPPRAGAAPFIARAVDREITITEGITVKELAEKLDIKAKDLMQRLISRGKLATINQTVDPQLATELSRDFGADVRVISFEEQQVETAVEMEIAEDTGEQQALIRPPVVTIMGHVDHGKTSLLDAIRESRVTESEAGGITQHIGAYQVEINSRKITFIDTPGHQAFTRMRARGAKVTDIVVLVVAADDGVMPQTLEAIDHARAANVPIIVAVNKIDKPEAQPERVKRQLADRGLMSEEWGGQTVTVEVSAKMKQNLDTLLEMILLVADMQELKAYPGRLATGTVLEAELDRGRGPVATVLVQNGTLKAGDPFIVGPVWGKVRALINDRGQPIEDAPPATPIEVLGLSGLPQAGDHFQVVTDVVKAKQTASYREQKAREAALARSARVSLDQLHAQLAAGAVKELNIVLKGDVHGSVEVLTDTLTKLSTEKVKIKVLRSGVGAISESDVLLASASNAIIIGFSVRPERSAEELAEQEDVEIRLHTIIYELVDEMKKAMLGLLEPTLREVRLGRADVRDTFRIPKVGTVAGCYVQDGRVTRDAQVRLLRDNVVIYTGKVASLRRFKDDASEVKAGFECGIGLENFADVKQGDVIEAFVVEKVAAEVLV